MQRKEGRLLPAVTMYITNILRAETIILMGVTVAAEAAS